MTALEVHPAAALESLRLSEGFAGLGERFVARLDPTPLPEPYPIAFNPDVAALIGLARGPGGANRVLAPSRGLRALRERRAVRGRVFRPPVRLV